MNQVADFLVELGTEELPPKSLKTLAEAFHQQLVAKLAEAELSFEDSEWFATPRRLAIRVLGLQTQQQDKQVERLGPAVAASFNADGSAKPAAIGFAQSCGVSIEELQRVETPKGQRLAYNALVSGSRTQDLLPEMLAFTLSKLPIAKPMRWGSSNSEFIRPPHWLLVLLGENVVPCQLLELTADRISFGHRFHAPQAIQINSPMEYTERLLAAKVQVSFAARKAMIREQVEAIALKEDAIAVINENLLEEVAALVEWPVALSGQFDRSFLHVPAEALIATMQSDQKYFHLVDRNHQLLPRFITVSNIDSSHPQSVIAGNERVIRPRLADAKFFFDADCKVTLESYTEKLKTIVFQNKLGSLFDKTQRVKAIATWIAGQIGSSSALAERAAELSKCDLMSNMVYEFPELQGIMGRYYATNDGESGEVAAAMDEIYKPRFAGDELALTNTGVALALADRIDTLVGIFGIGQPPSGTKDPFALRRAALGVLRMLVEKQITIDLRALLEISQAQFKDIKLIDNLNEQILDFFDGRLVSWYQEKGFSTQVIQSVTTLKLSDPLDIDRRIRAVNAFNDLESSEALAAANKRVGNILAKSEVDVNHLMVDPDLLEEAEEKALYETLTKVESQVNKNTDEAKYEQALTSLSNLRDVVDAFFDKVMVNAEQPAVRNNRLALLRQLRALFLSIADISLLQK